MKLDDICSLVKAKLNGIQIEFNVSVKRLQEQHEACCRLCLILVIDCAPGKSAFNWATSNYYFPYPLICYFLSHAVIFF